MKKLYRSKSDYVFAGVCGGLGEYLYIDPKIIRVVWLAAVLFFGSGLLLYILFCFIVPKED